MHVKMCDAQVHSCHSCQSMSSIRTSRASHGKSCNVGGMTTTPERATANGWTPDDSTFGARLALIRQRMGWGNVREAALACGIPAESWRTWERDGITPRRIVEMAGLIADATGCDYGWLLAGPRLQGSGAARGLTVPYTPVTVRPPIASRPRDNRPNGRPPAELISAGTRTAHVDRSRPPRRDR